MWDKILYCEIKLGGLYCSMIFIESKVFSKAAQQLLTDDELADLQQSLLQNPNLGDLIPGTGGLRKLRIGQHARGKGKRGGARVIYYFLQRRAHLHLLLLYSKAQAEDLTADQKKNLRQWIKEIETT
jgi:hypothetical protein